MAMSRSAQAVKWLNDNPDKSQSDAAREFDIDRSVVARAVKARGRKQENMCPCCGQTIRVGAKPGAAAKSSE